MNYYFLYFSYLISVLFPLLLFAANFFLIYHRIPNLDHKRYLWQVTNPLNSSHHRWKNTQIPQPPNEAITTTNIHLWTGSTPYEPNNTQDTATATNDSVFRYLGCLELYELMNYPLSVARVDENGNLWFTSQPHCLSLSLSYLISKSPQLSI